MRKWIGLVWRYPKEDYDNLLFGTEQWVARSFTLWFWFNLTFGSAWLGFLLLIGFGLFDTSDGLSAHGWATALPVLTDWPVILTFLGLTLIFPLLANWLAWRSYRLRKYVDGSIVMYGIWVVCLGLVTLGGFFLTGGKWDPFAPEYEMTFAVLGCGSVFSAVAPMFIHAEQVKHRLEKHRAAQRKHEPLGDGRISTLAETYDAGL